MLLDELLDVPLLLLELILEAPLELLLDVPLVPKEDVLAEELLLDVPVSVCLTLVNYQSEMFIQRNQYTASTT